MKKKPPLQTIKAFTLLELVLCLALLAMMLFGGVRAWAQLHQDQQRKAITAKLEQALNFARQAAIAKREQVSICPRETDMTCGRDWSQGWLIFLDADNRGQLANEGQVLWRETAVYHQPIQFSGWLKHQYVRFESDGMPHSYHGTFLLSGKPMLVINAVGRIRRVNQEEISQNV
ncbi:MAG: putative type pilus assembly protein fimt [Gammaproteobacteria bacterium]|jgi:type IV fimbrial biogenesis protein FimT|nr:putative type pilus assembly protein fimt [Gammaproteobacteria bacterium]